MIIGIDLGTTFSSMAYVDHEGAPNIIPNQEGARSTPSAIMIDDNEVVVGEIAKESAIIDDSNVVQHIKNEMGNNHYNYRNRDGDSYSCEELSAFILKKLKQDSEDFLGTDIKEAVITVPAYFTDAQRKATQDAGNIAGLKVRKIINEPTAAAILFARSNKIKSGNILVYDLGGGTFDVSIISYSPDEISVKSTDGIRMLGGHFFDRELVELVAEYLDEKHDIDIFDEEYIDELQGINQKLEECKIHLSTRKKTTISIKIGNIRERIKITRDDFEKRIAKYYMRTEYVVKNALKSADMDWDDIDKVLMIGGSTRIPYIRESLEKLCGKPLSYEANPDEAVALGAAIQASLLEEETEETTKVIDVSSHSLGIVILDAKTGKYANEIMLRRNSILPAQYKREFYTSDHRQEVVTLRITEGEYRDIEDVTIVGSFDIDLPPNLDKGTKVEIKMGLDEEQLITIHTRIEEVADFFKEIHFNRESNMDKDQVEKKRDLLANLEVS